MVNGNHKISLIREKYSSYYFQFLIFPKIRVLTRISFGIRVIAHLTRNFSAIGVFKSKIADYNQLHLKQKEGNTIR